MIEEFGFDTLSAKVSPHVTHAAAFSDAFPAGGTQADIVPVLRAMFQLQGNLVVTGRNPCFFEVR